MRRFALFATGGAIWLLLMAVPVFADNGPHVMGQAAQAAIGSCSGCHRAHSGQEPMLLKEAVTTLCLSCHSGVGSNLNVVDGEGYATQPGALRGGGYSYTLIATGTLAANPATMPSNGSTLAKNANIPTTTAHATTSAHSVNGSAVTAWGAGELNAANNGTAVNLTCASCHNPHGNGQYRILNPAPDGAYTTGVAKAVNINDATVKTYWTANYGQNGQIAADMAESPLNDDGSSLNYTVSTKTFQGTYVEASSRWCAMCHTRYFAPSGSAGNKTWTAAGSTDAVYTFRHAQRNVVDPTTTGAPDTGVINPISSSSQLKGSATLGAYPFASAWKASQAYAFGAEVSSVANASGDYYAATVGGTTGATEPIWPGSVGGTVVDGTVTWQNKGPALMFRGVAVLANASGLNSAGAAGAQLTTSAPRCITCHVSHGTSAVAGAYTTGEDSLVTGAKLGSTLLRLNGRTACQACHAK